MKKDTNFLAILPAIHMIEKIQKKLNELSDLNNASSLDKNWAEFSIEQIVSEYNDNAKLKCTHTFSATNETSVNSSSLPCVFIRFYNDDSFIIRITTTEWTPIWT